MTRSASAMAMVALLMFSNGSKASPPAMNSLESGLATPVETAKPEEERLVCSRTRHTGSHRVMRVCRTIEEARVERRAAEESMRRKRSQPDRDTLNGL